MALHTWLGRAILSPEHHKDLENAAADHEFGAVKLDRKTAEESAYTNYKNRLHSEAIAHHLAGMRAAVSQGKPAEGELHNAMYNLHMKALGLKPGSMPPATSESQKPFSSIDKFAPHDADQLLLTKELNKNDREDFYRASNTDSIYLSEPDISMELSKALRSPMSLEQLNGKKVKVYFNLRNRQFSVMHNGAVVAHVPEVSLTDVRFNVHQSGHQKVLDSHRKNVHAFVEGTFTHQAESPQLLPQGVKYNPYKYASFVRSHDESPITSAKAAVLKNLPHPTITVQEQPVQATEPSWRYK